jgi:hypothetical protein
MDSPRPVATAPSEATTPTTREESNISGIADDVLAGTVSGIMSQLEREGEGQNWIR